MREIAREKQEKDELRAELENGAVKIRMLEAAVSHAEEQSALKASENEVLQLRLQATIANKNESELAEDSAKIQMGEEIGQLKEQVSTLKAEQVSTKTQLALKNTEIGELKQEVRRYLGLAVHEK